MHKYIIVKTHFRGFHAYLDAPDKVAFLRNLHRHDFLVEAKIEVSHSDRELEFFIVQEDLDNIIKSEINFNDVGSCEMAAGAIIKGLLQREKYRNRLIEVSVSEDGENRGVISLDESDLDRYHSRGWLKTLVKNIYPF
jgi:hypothetical protein